MAAHTCHSMNRVYTIWILLSISLLSCSEDTYTYTPLDFPDDSEEPPGSGDSLITDEALLDLAQRETFRYFWEFAETHSGAARERYHMDDPAFDAHTVATGGSGFGLMAILVGIERNFISRAEGVDRLGKILDFFENADRFHGAWPHWLEGATGNTRPFSSLDDGGDLVETAFLAQGLICVQEYFKDGSTDEQALSAQAADLWKGIEWNWYTRQQKVLYWHWSPNHGFAINLPLRGYNETLIAYVLAAASPGFGIDREVYTEGWASSGGIQASNLQYGIPLVLKHSGAEQFGGPLFWAHYSYLGLDPRNLRDAYADYWEVHTNHAKINYQYCLENPKGYNGYGPNNWGLTASYSRNTDGTLGYNAHQPNNDTGEISPTAALSSMPYTPEESLRALRYFYANQSELLGPAGFYDAFSPEYDFWVAKAYLAIDQGPIIAMIENYRTQMLWDLFMQNEAVKDGLDTLGFTY